MIEPFTRHCGAHGRDLGDLALAQTWKPQNFLPYCLCPHSPASRRQPVRTSEAAPLHPHSESGTLEAQRRSSGSVGGLNALLPLLSWVLALSRPRRFRDRKRKSGTSSRSQSRPKAESLRPVERVRGRRLLPAGREVASYVEGHSLRSCAFCKVGERGSWIWTSRLSFAAPA